jgi:hypothetical protein
MVALPCGVQINHQHALADFGQTGGKIDRGGGLADAALLVGDTKNLSAHRGSRE